MADPVQKGKETCWQDTNRRPDGGEPPWSHLRELGSQARHPLHAFLRLRHHATPRQKYLGISSRHSYVVLGKHFERSTKQPPASLPPHFLLPVGSSDAHLILRFSCMSKDARARKGGYPGHSWRVFEHSWRAFARQPSPITLHYTGHQGHGTQTTHQPGGGAGVLTM